MKYNNCLFWALKKWFKDGGYIVIRRSKYGWFPHFLWMCKDTIILESYVPKNPKKRTFPPILFRGHVKRGDEHLE